MSSKRRTALHLVEKSASNILGILYFGVCVGFTSSPVIAQLQAQRISALPIEISSFAIEELDKGVYDIVFAASLPVRLGARDNQIALGPTFMCIDKTNSDKEMNATGPGSISGPLAVHVLSGQHDYAQERTGWPQAIGVTCKKYDPTVAIGDMNFDGNKDIVVGGHIADVRDFHAFNKAGVIIPGWESGKTPAPPFLNAPAIFTSTADGAPRVSFVDESCYLVQFGALGSYDDMRRRRQCKVVTNNGYSSPAVGDVARPNQLIGDGIPDEITAGNGSFGVNAYDSMGKDLNCDNPSPDRLWGPLGHDCEYFSSPAAADFEGQGTQSIAIQCARRVLRVFTNHGLEEYSLPLDLGVPQIGKPSYSSPAIADLNKDGKLEIIVGSDSGHVVVLTYDPDQPAGSKLRLFQYSDTDPLWTPLLLNAGYSISSSPLVADILDGDGKPEIVVANDAGYVHIIDSQTRSVRATYSLLNGLPWTADAAIYSTPAIGLTRVSEDDYRTQIVAGNRHGVFRIVLTDEPPIDLQSAPWPTFHANNARTGSLPFPVVPVKSSVGGTAEACTRVELRTSDCSRIADDYYDGPGQAHLVPVSDGRFVFEMVDPGAYCVRFIGPNPPQDWVIPEIKAGMMAQNTVSCR